MLIVARHKDLSASNADLWKRTEEKEMKLRIIESKQHTKLVAFFKILEMINETEVPLTFSEEGISTIVMDPSHVAMLDLVIPASIFEEYDSSEVTNPVTINTGEARKVLERFDLSKESLTITLDEPNAKLIFHAKREGLQRRFNQPLLEPYEEEVPEPKIAFKGHVRPTLENTREAVESANFVSEHVKLSIAKKDGKTLLTFSASGDLGDYWHEDEGLGGDCEEDEVNATYTLSYLLDCIKMLKPLCEVVKFSLSTDMPLKLEGELDAGKAIFYLAPCIGTT